MRCFSPLKIPGVSINVTCLRMGAEHCAARVRSERLAHEEKELRQVAGDLETALDSNQDDLALVLLHTASAMSLRFPTHIGRRACIQSAGATLLVMAPRQAPAAPVVRVKAYPALEYLEPIYELKLSLDALGPVAGDEARWPALRKRLDKFFGGGPLSERF